jgi:hypothetical protein
LIAVFSPDSEFHSAVVCGVNRLESGQRRRRDGQQPEGDDVGDPVLRQRHPNQLPIPQRHGLPQSVSRTSGPN